MWSISNKVQNAFFMVAKLQDREKGGIGPRQGCNLAVGKSEREREREREREEGCRNHWANLAAVVQNLL